MIKTYEGEVQFGDARYERVRVAFREEGGGEDFEDVFFILVRYGDRRNRLLGV
nr:DUF6503 family protein [Nitritalea halalkaliphila]